MFETVITADLPSTERPGAARGDQSYAKSHDRVSLGSAHLLDALRRVFWQAGVRDLAWVKVDDEVVYQDVTGGTVDEVDDLLKQAATVGYLGRPFFQLELAACHHEDEVRHVVLTRVSTAVPAGEPELVIQIASLPDGVVVRQGESPAAYVSRMQACAADEAQVGRWVSRIAHLRDRLETALKEALTDSSIGSVAPRLVLIRPGRPELASVEGLRFGEHVVPPHYDLAIDGRWPHWPSVFPRVWADGYSVFRNLLWLDAVMEMGFLHTELVAVCEPDGRMLFDGRRAHLFASWPWRKRFELRLGQDRVDIRFPG